MLFWNEAMGHPNLGINMARHPQPGWPPVQAVSVVSKYFPTSCASYPIGNIQNIDANDHFEATTIGQTELDLKV